MRAANCQGRAVRNADLNATPNCPNHCATGPTTVAPFFRLAKPKAVSFEKRRGPVSLVSHSSTSFFLSPRQLWSLIGTHGLLERGFVVYDTLFAWARQAADERHNWPAKKTEKAA